MLAYNDYMQKELIKSRFNKSVHTYETYAVVQKKMAEILVSLADKENYDNILELGCGTGFVTKELVKKVKFKSYYAIDIAENCENYIRKISDKINFICEDIEKIDINIYSNLIISNASLQWLENLPEFINKTMLFLADGGSFIFSIFGRDNYKELNLLINRKPQYRQPDEILELLKDYSVEFIKDEHIVLNFNSPKDVLYHMKYTGVNALSQTKWTKKDLENFEKEYLKICPEKITLTYHPIYIKIKNSNN